MKLLTIIITAIFLSCCGDNNRDTYYNEESFSSTYESIEDENEIENENSLPQGLSDCSAYNTSNGNGPYTLDCERDGDEIRLNFPNGGYIDLDQDGYDPQTGEQWEIE